MQSRPLAIHIPFYKRLLSFVLPFRIRQGSSDVNAEMEVLLYRNRLQLATTNALYSDGDHYKPAALAVDHLKKAFPNVKNVLLLGSGLGSLVKVIVKRGYAPHFTLVEYDKVVLRWALEFLQTEDIKIDPICADARDFIENNKAPYDFIFVDIFVDMVVPDFVTTQHFLQLCRRSLAPGGHLALNYIAKDPEEWQETLHNMQAVFPGHQLIDGGVNKVFIASVK